MKKWLNRKHKKAKKKKKAQAERSELHFQVFVGVVIVLVLGLLITAVYYGTRVSSLQIIDVEIVGGYTIPHEKVSAVVEDELQGSYFHLVPRRFAPFFPAANITARLQEIPRLKQTDFTTKDQTLIVVFDEYQPEALWCDVEETACAFVDQTGFAFARAPELTGSAFVRYIEPGKTLEIKSDMIERDFLEASAALAERLAKELSLYVTHVTIIDDFDVTYRVAGGGEIKVARTMDTDDTFTNLKTILLSEDFAHLETGSFAYIDLRFGDKVFVNEVGTSTQAETASSSEEAVERSD